jgi:sulfate adenylyltransferase subunit 1 (EFTu-like GTPase family)
MLCRVNNQPHVSQDIEAMLCWMSEQPLDPSSFYRIKHTTREARVKVQEVLYNLDINTLHRNTDIHTLALNEIGRVKLRSTLPLFTDSYEKNRITGGFILIHEATNNTVAAGMII